MRNLLIPIIVICALLICSVTLSAAVKVKVKGIIETKNKKPKSEEKNTAFQNGKVQALKKYISGLDSQRLQILNELMPEIQANLDTYVLETNSLSDGVYTNGQWEINLEVSINDAQIEQLINSKMKDKISKNGETYLSFVYVAREVSSVEDFDSIVSKTASGSLQQSNMQVSGTNSSALTTVNGKINTTVTQQGSGSSTTNVKQTGLSSQTTDESSASISGKATGIYNSDNVSGSVTVKASDSTANKDVSTYSNQTTDVNKSSQAQINTNSVTTGGISTNTTSNTVAVTNRDQSYNIAYKSSGSVVKNSEGLTYRVYNPSEIDTKVTEVFNKANFDVVPAYEVNITPEQFAYDFATLNEVSSSTQKEATNLAREGGLDFLAIGMLDVGREEIDPVTGQYKIYVKVNGYIMDLRKKFAIKICSVGPVQYSGFGENPTVAKTNALIEASTKASRDLVDQLRVKQGM